MSGESVAQSAAIKMAVINAWEACTKEPFPLYDGDAEAIGFAVIAETAAELRMIRADRDHIMADRDRLRAELEELKAAYSELVEGTRTLRNEAYEQGRAEKAELVVALERISAVQMTEPPPITDADWLARLMQHTARTALAKVKATQDGH